MKSPDSNDLIPLDAVPPPPPPPRSLSPLLRGSTHKRLLQHLALVIIGWGGGGVRERLFVFVAGSDCGTDGNSAENGNHMEMEMNYALAAFPSCSHFPDLV